MDCSRSVLLDRPALPATPFPTAIEHLLPGHLVEAVLPEVMDRVLDPSAGGLDLGAGGLSHGWGRQEIPELRESPETSWNTEWDFPRFASAPVFIVLY